MDAVEQKQNNEKKTNWKKFQHYDAEIVRETVTEANLPAPKLNGLSFEQRITKTRTAGIYTAVV